MTARWHLGPITGFHFWWVLVTSPEVLVFLFFMITDPKTAPSGPRARVVYAVSLGLLASLLIAPPRTEFASKVALLGALAIVCLAQPVAAPLAHAAPRPALALAAPRRSSRTPGCSSSSNAPAPSTAAPRRRPGSAARRSRSCRRAACRRS